MWFVVPECPTPNTKSPNSVRFSIINTTTGTSSQGHDKGLFT